METEKAVKSVDCEIKSPGVQAGAEKTKSKNRTYSNYNRGKKNYLSFQNIEEAEQKTLGLILWEPDRITQASNVLTTSSFRYEKHRLIFCAMLDMAKQNNPIDVYTLWCFLEERGQLDSVGRASYLTYLCAITSKGVELL
jgi:replicative DNA helicase